ncbi:MAG TPA: chemotaxis protein CheB [Pseudonocardiaceae bacterium]|nr:chemotaxis protein CheB [Pseudonocardiaceae bacterium]
MADSPRALIAVGASAGGVAALQTFVEALPADLPAAILVVLHLPPGGTSALASILDRSGPLPATPAQQGGVLRAGHIYTAVPDHHLIAVDTESYLSRGPTENGHRPAVDALFRSVALEHGPRSIGVVLSGALDDGTAGLTAIKSRGGLAIVQDPDEAACRGMPESALSRIRVDHVLRAGDMGAALAKRLAEPVPDWPATSASRIDELEARLAAARSPELLGSAEVPGVAASSGLSCPDCQGVLFSLDSEGWRYRCRIGHAWTAQALLHEQGAEVDRALWTALRAVEEKRDLAQRMRDAAAADGRKRTAARYADQVEEVAHAAAVLRGMLYTAVPQPADPDTERRPNGQ